MQTLFAEHYPSLGIRILGINEEGQEFGNSAVTQSLPMLQDVDSNGDGNSDVWQSWDVEWRDVRILNRQNDQVDNYNLTPHPLSVATNFNTLRDKFIEAARRTPASPHQSPIEPLNVNNDAGISPLDALLVINDLGAYPPDGVLPTPPGGTTLTKFVDVDGNNRISPLDALLVINQLDNITSFPSNRPASASSSAAAADLPTPTGDVVEPIMPAPLSTSGREEPPVFASSIEPTEMPPTPLSTAPITALRSEPVDPAALFAARVEAVFADTADQWSGRPSQILPPLGTDSLRDRL